MNNEVYTRDQVQEVVLDVISKTMGKDYETSKVGSLIKDYRERANVWMFDPFAEMAKALRVSIDIKEVERLTYIFELVDYLHDLVKAPKAPSVREALDLLQTTDLDRLRQIHPKGTKVVEIPEGDTVVSYEVPETDEDHAYRLKKMVKTEKALRVAALKTKYLYEEAMSNLNNYIKERDFE
jgi:hypothetical protein